MKRIIGYVENVDLPPNSYDLVITSPPSYPSPMQPLGALGTESTLASYLERLGAVLRKLRKSLRYDGILCLIIEPQPEHPIMEPLAVLLANVGYRCLSIHAWNHPPTKGSWVVFLAPPGRARLAQHESLQAKEWLMPYDTVDHAYGFFEFPQSLVDTVLRVALPHGGNVLDPFGGKATALEAAEAQGRCKVTVIDPVNVAVAEEWPQRSD